MRKTVLSAAATISLAVGLLPMAAGAATSTAPTAPAGGIDWGTCASAGLNSRGAECAKVSVPLDYGKPNGKTIKIRSRASSTQCRTTSTRASCWSIPADPAAPA